MSKKSPLRSPFYKQHGICSQTLLPSAWQQLCHIYWSLWRKFSWKKTLLVICKILGLFVNTLILDDKCSFLNMENLIQSIQMQLSKKQKTFFEIISSFWKYRLTFEHFQKKKKKTFIADLFPQFQTAKDVVKRMSKKSRFRRPFEKE